MQGKRGNLNDSLYFLYMKSLKESLFDTDLAKRPIYSLFNIAKDHVRAVKRYEYTKNSLHKFVDDTMMNRVWKKMGSPFMNITNISPSSLSGYENKVLSTILNHIVIDKNGEFDSDELNKWLKNEKILKPEEYTAGKKVDLMDVYANVSFIDPREKGAWMHKIFDNGPVERECYEIDIQFRYKENDRLALAFYICLNIKWSKMDEILGEL